MDTPQGSPHLNEPAPDFEVKTTHEKRKLEDYKAKWSSLFSHPGDFTPVCSSEFIAFTKAYPEFQNLDCELLGLSIDSTFSHIAWIRNIKQNFEIDIPFPIGDNVLVKNAATLSKSFPNHYTFQINSENIGIGCA